MSKWEYKLLHHVHKNTKVIALGKAVTELICLINSRKDTKEGTPIHSQSKAVKTLSKSNKWGFVDELFIRTNGYYATKEAKKWKLTKLSDEVLKQSINIFFDKFDILCPSFETTYSSKCNSNTRTQLITLNINLIKEQSLSSILHLLSLTVGYK